jgi:hypothetical protein
VIAVLFATQASTQMAEAGREVKAELDVICEYPGFQRGGAETSRLPKQRLEAFENALLLSTKAESLPTIFTAVDMMKLNGCKKSPEYVALKELYRSILSRDKRGHLLFTEVPQKLEELDRLLNGYYSFFFLVERVY